MATLYDVEPIAGSDYARRAGVNVVRQQERVVRPANGTDFTLDELYALLRCATIEFVALRDRRIMVIDEAGKAFEPMRPYNYPATALAAPSIGSTDWISGPALVCEEGEVR